MTPTTVWVRPSSRTVRPEHVGPAAEGATPEPVAQDDDQLGTRPVIRRLECAADDGQRAEHVEEVTRDHAPRRGHRLAAVLPDYPAERGLHGGQLLQRAAAGAPVAVVGVGDLEPGVGLVEREGLDGHQLRRCAERRRLEEHRPHRAEERGDRANAEGEGEDGGEGGGAMAHEAPEREAQVWRGHGWETSGGSLTALPGLTLRVTGSISVGSHVAARSIPRFMTTLEVGAWLS